MFLFKISVYLYHIYLTFDINIFNILVSHSLFYCRDTRVTITRYSGKDPTYGCCSLIFYSVVLFSIRLFSLCYTKLFIISLYRDTFVSMSMYIIMHSCANKNLVYSQNLGVLSLVVEEMQGSELCLMSPVCLL